MIEALTFTLFGIVVYALALCYEIRRAMRDIDKG